MEANSFKIAKVFSGGGDIQYILPHFQREYAWGQPEWETLLTDAYAIYDEAAEDTEENGSELEHFLGSLVVINSGTVAGTIARFKLVDGQQRLTTISLLLCALMRIVQPKEPALAKKIGKLLINEDEQGDVYFKLLPTTKYGDQAAYKAIIKGGAPPQGESRIPTAFHYLQQQLRGKIEKGEILPERLFRILTHVFQVVFIELNQNESPYKIFESLNAKGKPLSQADLVRNFIAMTLPASGQEEVFCDHWAKIEELLQEKRTVGRSGIGELTAFLRHYLAMDNGVLCNEKHVYARFRDRINKHFQPSAQFVQEIVILHEYAILYDRLLRPERQPDPKIRAAMERLDVLELSTAYPFLLAVSHAYHTGTISSTEFADALELLENYLMRRFLAEEPTNYLNKMFPQLWHQIDEANFLPSLWEALLDRKYPSDNRIRQKLLTRPLYQKKDTTRKQVVFLLQQVNRHLSSGTGGYTVLNENPTIEHILPQTPGVAWQAELGAEFSRYQEFVHTLGNLTLVTQEWNSTLSNSAFTIKKDKLASHALLLNNQYFSQDLPLWNEAAIQARSEYLIDRILQIWPRLEDETENGNTPAQPTANFHPQVAEAVAKHLNFQLTKRSQKQYEGLAESIRVLCSVSGIYSKTDYTEYWFSLSKAHYEYLSTATQGYAAFGCGSEKKALLISFQDFTLFAPQMNVTSNEQRHYWHIKIYERGNRFYLGQPGIENSVDVTEYLLPTSLTS